MSKSTQAIAEYIGCDQHEGGQVRWYKVTGTSDSSDDAYAVFANRARREGSGRWIGRNTGADDLTAGHEAAIDADAERMSDRPGCD